MARFKVTPVVYLLFRDKDKILMLRRFQTGYMNGYYCFPAGHLEGGETFTQAAAREAQEEVGAVIETESLKLVHVMHRLAIEKDHERMDIFFEVSRWTGELHNAEPEKCDDAAWLVESALPQNTVPEIRQVLEKIRGGEMYSDFGFDV